MSVFTPAEIAYLQSQRLGRLGMAGADAQPHVVPVAFRYNPAHDAIEIRSHAEVVASGGTELGPGFDPEMIRIKPKRIVGWGIDTHWRAPANAGSIA
jgi:hypothetical protein